MSKPSLARIRQSFERAAATYDAAATVQRRICERLARGLPALDQPRYLLDSGCGTGYAGQLLRQRYPRAELLSLDLSAGMLATCPDKDWRIAANLEQLPIRTGCLDLYWSSLAMQWCDPARSLDEARRVLAPGAHLAVSTLGPATFRELRQAFAGIDHYRHTLPFHDSAELAHLAAQAGLTAVNIEKHPETVHYADLRTLLRAVKAVGANQLGAGRRTGLMSRPAFARLENAYESLRTANGLPLSYEVIYLHARS